MGRPKGSKNKTTRRKSYTCDAGGCYTDSDSCSDSDCSDCYGCPATKKKTTAKKTTKSKAKPKASTSKGKKKTTTTRRKSKLDYSSSSCSCSDCMDDYSSSDDAFDCGRGIKCPR